MHWDYHPRNERSVQSLYVCLEGEDEREGYPPAGTSGRRDNDPGCGWLSIFARVLREAFTTHLLNSKHGGQVGVWGSADGEPWTHMLHWREVMAESGIATPKSGVIMGEECVDQCTLAHSGGDDGLFRAVRGRDDFRGWKVCWCGGGEALHKQRDE